MTCVPGMGGVPTKICQSGFLLPDEEIYDEEEGFPTEVEFRIYCPNANCLRGAYLYYTPSSNYQSIPSTFSFNINCSLNIDDERFKWRVEYANPPKCGENSDDDCSEQLEDITSNTWFYIKSYDNKYLKRNSNEFVSDRNRATKFATFKNDTNLYRIIYQVWPANYCWTLPNAIGFTQIPDTQGLSVCNNNDHIFEYRIIKSA